jgi:hypothetical protein
VLGSCLAADARKNKKMAPAVKVLECFSRNSLMETDKRPYTKASCQGFELSMVRSHAGEMPPGIESFPTQSSKRDERVALSLIAVESAY